MYLGVSSLLGTNFVGFSKPFGGPPSLVTAYIESLFLGNSLPCSEVRTTHPSAGTSFTKYFGCEQKLFRFKLFVLDAQFGSPYLLRRYSSVNKQFNLILMHNYIENPIKVYIHNKFQTFVYHSLLTF